MTDFADHIYSGRLLTPFIRLPSKNYFDTSLNLAVPIRLSYLGTSSSDTFLVILALWIAYGFPANV